jgi:putative transposase
MAIEFVPDPVHLPCQVDPQFGIHRLVNNIKGVSSHTLRKEFPRLRSRIPTFMVEWLFSIDRRGAPVALIKPYVEKQKGV